MDLAILSGGQSGVDRAALDVAWEFKLGRGGWCSRGRMADDGVIDAQYDLTETTSDNSEEATTWNVRDSGGTLIITPGDPMGEARLALQVCDRLGKPHLTVDASDPKAADRCVHWISSHGFEVLYVTGPREATHHGMYARARDLLREVMGELSQPGGGEPPEF